MGREGIWSHAASSRSTAKPISFFDGRRILYQAFGESMLDVPRRLARYVHELYFELQYDEFKPRTGAAC